MNFMDLLMRISGLMRTYGNLTLPTVTMRWIWNLTSHKTFKNSKLSDIFFSTSGNFSMRAIIQIFLEMGAQEASYIDFRFGFFSSELFLWGSGCWRKQFEAWWFLNVIILLIVRKCDLHFTKTNLRFI